MQLGIFSSVAGSGDLQRIVADARDAAERGFASYWLSQIVQQTEAMNVIGAVAQHVPDIRFGTSVVPTYPRHPMVMAEQAMTTSLLTDGRFTLGIGLSHQVVVEGMWGYSWDKPVRHAREYLDVLIPLLAGDAVNVTGDTITARGKLAIPAETPPVLFAALGEQMLRLAGATCDGTILWMTGARTIADHTVPTIREAAEAAGRPAPEIAAGVPIWVTDDVDGARERAAKGFAVYGHLPSYRAMLDKEGVEGPGDVAIIGTEAEVNAALDRLAAGGTTDFLAAVLGSSDERRRTLDLLTERAG